MKKLVIIFILALMCTCAFGQSNKFRASGLYQRAVELYESGSYADALKYAGQSREALAGNSVQLGNWGSFALTCSGTPADSKDAITAANIKGLNIRFLPGKSLKAALAGATFKPAESMVSHPPAGKS